MPEIHLSFPKQQDPVTIGKKPVTVDLKGIG